jgi:uncharacterized protein
MPEALSLTVDCNLPVQMRDGTTLYADVYRPAGPGPYPTLLTRTPYDKALRGPSPFVVRAASAGYAVVIQDVRGRFTSEGPFETFVNERLDGYDTLDWLASQPWCDGKVGMFGGSYVGLTQWQAALSGHEALKAIVPVVTASDYHDGWAYQGGAFELQFNLSWTLSVLATNTVIRETGVYSDTHESLIDAVDAMDSEFMRLPLNDHPNLKKYAAYYHNWIDHPAYDDELWGALDVSRNYDKLTVPAFNIGGWYDIFMGGTIENFTGMRAQGATEAARQNRLMIGPWNHGGMAAGNPIGEFDFGVRSTGGYIDAEGMQLAWYDKWLRGLDTDLDSQPPVRLFTMGVNEWRNAESWPLPGTEFQNWHFHSQGSANSLNGNGALSRDEPGSEPPDSYVYNPLNPVPTRGGGLCCNAVWSLGGAYDQRPVEAREDVLVYTSPPMEAPVNVTGPIKVILHASSSALDTDWTAKLVDVHPCGYARSLTDGIIRARYRNSMSDPELIEPGDIIEYEIDLWATSNVFQPGHSIRVEVSSSNFPRFDRNPNTGELPGRSADVASALQTVHHSAPYPSRIVLPVIEE